MGALTLPTSGLVYVDANAVIHAVEHIEPYFSLLTLLWTTSGPASFQIVTSELTLLEVLVRPFKTGNTQLEAGFRALLQQTGDVRLAPITQAILEEAARLRTKANLKTPDAIHAASALVMGVSLFVTNDPAFRRVPGLSVTVLRDLLNP